MDGLESCQKFTTIIIIPKGSRRRRFCWANESRWIQPSAAPLLFFNCIPARETAEVVK